MFSVGEEIQVTGFGSADAFRPYRAFHDSAQAKLEPHH
jgi:hypothetical protein